jgi:hypothetical protein
MHRIVIASIIVALAGGCASLPPVPCTETRELTSRAALAILRSAPRFETGSVGIVGRPGCYYTVYESLVAQPDAARSFRELYRSGTLAAKIYALDGLRRTDPATFAALQRTAFFTSTKRVEFVSGCVSREESVATLAQIVASGGFRGF